MMEMDDVPDPSEWTPELIAELADELECAFQLHASNRADVEQRAADALRFLLSTQGTPVVNTDQPAPPTLAQEMLQMESLMRCRVVNGVFLIDIVNGGVIISNPAVPESQAFVAFLRKVADQIEGTHVAITGQLAARAKAVNDAIDAATGLTPGAIQ